MSIDGSVRDEILRYLTMLREGFLELAAIRGRPGVAMRLDGRLVLPEGTRSLFLAVSASTDAARLTVADSAGRPLHQGEISRAESWICVDTAGSREIRLTVDRGVPAASLGIDAEEPIGLFLWDLEILEAAVSPRAPLSTPEGKRRLSVRLDLINKCNLRCQMCILSLDEIANAPRQLLSVEDFRALGPTLLTHTARLSLSQAYEPMLHPEFGAMLRLAREFEVPWIEMTSNATLVTEDAAKALVDAEVDLIVFSIDGATKETYETIRRGSRHERFIEGLDTLVRIKKQYRATLPAITFNMVLMRQNIDELPEVIRFAHRYGAKVMHTSMLVPQAGLDMESELLQHEPERANRAFAEARTVADELGMSLVLPDRLDPAAIDPTSPPVSPTLEGSSPPEPDSTAASLPAYLPLEPLPDPTQLDKPLLPKSLHPPEGPTVVVPGVAAHGIMPHDEHGREIATACAYPWTMAVMRPDRTVIPCCLWHDEQIMGDLSTQSFDELWNAAPYRRLRTELQTGRLRPCCRTCPERQPLSTGPEPS